MRLNRHPDFAFPSQTTYFSRDTGLDSERSRAAEAEVQAWRSKGTLPFPEFAEQQREQFRDTLNFPPEGSPYLNIGNRER